MTKVIAWVHPVHLMNADWAPGGRQPSDQANRLELWVRRKLAATVYIHHRHCYYYSALCWYSFYRTVEGGRLSRPKHCSKGAQPVPKAVHRSGCRSRHNRPRCDSNLGPVTPQSDALTTRPLRPAGCSAICGLLTHVSTFRGLYICVLVTTMSHAKDGWGDLEMPRQAHLSPRYRALDDGPQWCHMANTMDRSLRQRRCGLSLCRYG